MYICIPNHLVYIADSFQGQFIYYVSSFLPDNMHTQLKANSLDTKGHIPRVRSMSEPQAPRQYMLREVSISTTQSNTRLSRQPGGRWKNS